jgi:hypothetical protein
VARKTLEEDDVNARLCGQSFGAEAGVAGFFEVLE